LHSPAIAKEGVLRIGVDAHYPPYASFDGKQVVGLDADVAAALAGQLGLKPEFVDVPGDQLDSALREKRVDVAFGGVTVPEAALSDVAVSTSYLSDAPVLFARDASVSAESLDAVRVAVQKGSLAYWLVRVRVPQDRLVAFATLREAFAAVAADKADAVAGDGIVAGYVRRDFPALRFAGQLGDAAPLAVTVAKDGASIEAPVREAMDELAATGVLDAIRGKWLGDLPALRAASSAVTTDSLDTTAP
jgi:ABC-type amino acid transport substrate-binding protein